MSKEIEDKGAEIRRNYIREWRRNNRDKVREYNHRYWLRKAEKEAGLHEQKEAV